MDPTDRAIKGFYCIINATMRDTKVVSLFGPLLENMFFLLTYAVKMKLSKLQMKSRNKE